jgi:hypothetical protein
MGPEKNEILIQERLINGLGIELLTEQLAASSGR